MHNTVCYVYSERRRVKCNGVSIFADYTQEKCLLGTVAGPHYTGAAVL